MTAGWAAIARRGAAWALAAVIVAAGASSARADESLIRRMLNRVNEYRADAGLHRLVLEERLMRAAYVHAEDMARTATVSHVGSDGSKFTERFDRVGYDWQFGAENVAAGIASPEETVDSWMRSSGHRRNILNPDVCVAGIGYVFRLKPPGGRGYGHYWTLDLGRSMSTGCPGGAPKR